jgi:hypothetical protein
MKIVVREVPSTAGAYLFRYESEAVPRKGEIVEFQELQYRVHEVLWVAKSSTETQVHVEVLVEQMHC